MKTIKCPACNKKFATQFALDAHAAAKHTGNVPKEITSSRGQRECIVCGSRFGIVQETGMCGPCTFGEADTVDWSDEA